MNKTNIKRAINVMERTADENFNIRSWFCGTQACFAGTLALSEEGQAMGLRVRYGISRKRRMGIYVMRKDATVVIDAEAIGYVLGINFKQSLVLCGYTYVNYVVNDMPEVKKADMVKPKHIVNLLTKLLETGDI